MKRPEQHITETKSKRIFERLVPPEWVTREINPDYGVDYLIEIFEDNLSTGKNFFVQLKGSTQEIKDNTFEKQFTIDNLKYYNSLALPVLIVCVSVTTEKVWAIWANKLIELNQIEDDQKTLLISLSKEYQIDKLWFKNVAVQSNFSEKFGISTNPDSPLTESFNNHLLKWIENYFPKSVSVQFNNLPKNFELNYNTDENGAIKIEVSTSAFSKSIQISNLSESESFLYRPEFDDNEINNFNKNVLLSIAISLAKHDIEGTLKLLYKLIPELDLSDHKRWIDLDPLGLLVLAKEYNQISLYNNLVKEIIRVKQFDLFLFFDLAFFTIGTDQLVEYRIENLKSVIESHPNEEVQGTCHYNIGNILRTQNNNAIKHYIKAAKLYPDYRNRYYWWREIAGLFFVHKHFHWAEVCYKKSLELSNKDSEHRYLRLEKVSPKEENLTLALIADCLFIQGKFKEANSYFEKYFQVTEEASQEWILKNMICLELMGGELDSVTFDQDKSLRLCEKSLSLTRNEDIIENLNEAILLHPTNGLAWFNLGVALDKKQQFDQALFAFLMTGLTQDFDKEAQFNALMISFTQEKYDLIQAILIYITEKHGKTVINDLSDYIMQKDMPLKMKKSIIKAFKEMIDVIKTIKMDMTPHTLKATAI